MADIFSEDLLDDDPDRRKDERLLFEKTLEIHSEVLGKSDFVIGDNISRGVSDLFAGRV